MKKFAAIGAAVLGVASVVWASEIDWLSHVAGENYGSEPFDMRAVDLDGDGDVDLVTASTHYGNGDLTWWENDGTASFVEHTIRDLEDYWGLEVGDIDADGDIDIAVRRNLNNSADYRITVFENNGSELFAEHDLYANATAGSPELALGDLDGDGDLDVVAANCPPGAFTVYLHTQGMAFESFLLDTLTSPGGVDVGDVDADGDVDIVASSGGGTHLYRNDGTLAFTAELIDDGVRWQLFSLADVDSDGDLDGLGVNGPASKVSWFENGGARGFVEHIVYTGGHPTDLLAADLDLDGDMDLVRTDQADGSIDWFENDGSESFTRHVIGSGYNGSRGLVLADIDGDMDTDAGFCVYWGQDVVWYENLTALPEPIPSIMVNGSGEPLTVSPDTDVTVSISLNPGSMAGVDAQWWIGALTTSGSFWLNKKNQWVPSRRPLAHAVAAMQTVADEVVHTSALVPGIYTFVFILDTNIDAWMEPTWSDSVTVTSRLD